MSEKFEFELCPGTKRSIGGGAPVFIVGEIGTNWFTGKSHDDSTAKRLIEVAMVAGCDAVKFQTYTPEKVYVADPGPSNYLESNGTGVPLMELLRERVMPPKMISSLADYCARQNIGFMSSAFSSEDIELIDQYCGIHKLASYETSHVRLIEAFAATRKPLIMSMGASEMGDIRWAVEKFREMGGRKLVLNQCVAAYPAPENSLNLKVISWLNQELDVVPGYSDHTLHPTIAPIAAVALGAKVIEKHFTLDRSLEGPDHFNAIEPEELKFMVEAIRSTECMLGDGKKRVEDVEVELFNYANRYIQALRDITPGETLKEDENMAILRPGNRTSGAHPKLITEFEGQIAGEKIAAYEGIHQSMLRSS